MYKETSNAPVVEVNQNQTVQNEDVESNQKKKKKNKNRERCRAWDVSSTANTVKKKYEDREEIDLAGIK